MQKEILVATIAAVGTVVSSAIAAGWVTENKIAKLSVVSAGSVTERGQRSVGQGRDFSVTRTSAGTYRINFTPSFETRPIVVATSDGGREGAAAEVSDVDPSGFRIEGRTYREHALADIGFDFVAVRPELK